MNSKLWIPLRHVLLIAFLAILFGLGARSFIQDDFRYGWHMFRYKVQWRVEYYLIKDDGTTFSYKPGKELKGGNKKVLGKGAASWYGIGYARSIVKGYLKYTFDKLAFPDNIVGMQANLRFRKNNDKEWIKEIYRYPPSL